MLETAPACWMPRRSPGAVWGRHPDRQIRADVHFEKDDRRSRAVYDNFYGDKLLRNLRIVDVMRPHRAGARRLRGSGGGTLDSGSPAPERGHCGHEKPPAQAEANAVALTFRLTQDEVGRAGGGEPGIISPKRTKKKRRALFCGCVPLCLASSITDTGSSDRVIIPPVDAEELRITRRCAPSPSSGTARWRSRYPNAPPAR